MGLLKNILLITGILVAVVGFRMCQVSGVQRDGASTGDFVAIPRPANAPEGKVLLIGPENCPKEAGRRIDALERAIHAAGIPCVRLTNVSMAPSSNSEAKRVDKVMTGELPVVFVGNYAKNNPSLEEVKARLRSKTP